MVDDASPAYATDPDNGDPLYVYKPSVMGAPCELRLAADALVYRVGGRSGRVPYDGIRRVRLSFRPVTMQSYRFLAEIWPLAGPKLQIVSTSWRSMVELTRLDAAYAAFLAELHRRVATAGAMTTFTTGSPPLLYWPALAVFVMVALALAALTVRGLQAGATAGAVFVVVFLGVFLWQAGTFLRRNRPGSYRPEAIPPVVLPR